MIPEPIARFLERPLLAIAGTRDAQLVPHVHRVSAWRLGEDGDTVDCFVAEPFTEHLLDALEHNGRIAVTFSEVPSHETYQLKGRFLEARDLVASDLELYERQREQAIERVTRLFPFPASAMRAYLPTPVVAIRYRVDEIFDQTPGPEAGRRLEVHSPEERV